MNTTTTDPPGPRIGSLCSGYGGLDEAVRSVFGGSLAWVSDIDPGACKILAHRYPGIPNLGDFTTVDWAGVEPVDIVAAGYPCQPFSHAGRRSGANDERHLWPYVTAGVAALRPTLCIFENVRGHLTLGFDEVLRDLDYLGYDTDWHLLEAAEVGAPHRRSRLFILARRRTDGQLHRRTDRRGGLPGDLARQGGGHVHDPHPGGDGHEVDARAVAAACAVRGTDDEAPPRDGGERGEGRVGARRGGRLLAAPAGQAAPHPEGEPGGMPSRPVGVDPEEPGSEGPAALGRLAAPPRTAPDAASAGGQPAGPADAGAGTAGRATLGGAPLGRVVGARRRPLRSSDVPWATAQFRDDAERPGIRAPHGRFRVFVLAWPAGGAVADAAGAVGRGRGERRPHTGRAAAERYWGAEPSDGGRRPSANTDSEAGGRDKPGSVTPRPAQGAQPAAGRLLPDGRAPAHAAGHGWDEGRPEPAGLIGGSDVAVSGDAAADTDGGVDERRGAGRAVGRAPGASEGDRGERERHGGAVDDRSPAFGGTSTGTPLRPGVVSIAWGPYEPAIRRWERRLGRSAPAPTEPGSKGQPRLSPAFVEWMMGLPAGWVTDVPGLSRNDQLKALGNGVVPQQAAVAVLFMLARLDEELRWAA